MRDLLTVQVDLPEIEEGQDLLTEAIANPGIFDHQLYIFETSGILVSLLYKTPEEAAALLLSLVKPLLEDLSAALQAAKGGGDAVQVLKVHHVIMALGNVAKGFPDYPSPVPEGYILPPLAVFTESAQAIVVCLEAMNGIKVIRDAVSGFVFFGMGACGLMALIACRPVLHSRGSLERQGRTSRISSPR